MRQLVALRSVPAANLVATGSAVAALALLILRGAAHDWVTGDTRALVAGLEPITHCRQSGRQCGDISKFAALQQIPAYALHLIGLSGAAVVGALVWLNVIAVVGLIAATTAWAYRCAGLPLAVIGALLMGCGMLLSYSAQSFGEPLAAAAFAGVALTGLRADRVSRWLVLLAGLATISKETAAPFTFLLGLAAIGLSGAVMPVVRRAALHLTIGVAAGEVLNVGFDFFRYGKLYNPAYLDEARAPSSMWLSNGAGMLISPNAGITWFWPGAAIAVVVLILTVARTDLPGLDGRRARVSAIAGLAVIAAMVASLADWWSPFGWYAWGPRLLMPIAAGVTALSLAVIQRHALARTWLSVPGAVALATVCALSLLPSVAVVFRPASYTAQVTGAVTRLPICSPAHQNTSRTTQDFCNNTFTWSPRSMPLTVSVEQAATTWHYWVVIVFGWLSVALWLRLAYRAARRTGRKPAELPDPAGGSLAQRGS